MGTKLKKGKIVRREGFNLFDAEKFSRILARRSYGPGVHGPKSFRRRNSTYGEQLRAKQQLKLMYGLREKQFTNLIDKAMRAQGNTAEEIVRMLELRLDNVVFRLQLAKTRSQARQLVSHGHIIVNGKTVDIPSYTVRKGEQISIKESAQKNKYFTEKFNTTEKKEKDGSKAIPAWLSWDASTKSGKVTNDPETESTSNLISISKVVEFYSR